MSLMASFCAVLFPTRCLGWDLGLNWVSFWGFSYLLLIQDTCCYLSKMASALIELPWHTQSLRNIWLCAVNWDEWSKVFEICYGTQLLNFYFDVSLSVIGAVCHQFGNLNTWSPSYTSRLSTSTFGSYLDVLIRQDIIVHCKWTEWSYN